MLYFKCLSLSLKSYSQNVSSNSQHSSLPSNMHRKLLLHPHMFHFEDIPFILTLDFLCRPCYLNSCQVKENPYRDIDFWQNYLQHFLGNFLLLRCHRGSNELGMVRDSLNNLNCLCRSWTILARLIHSILFSVRYGFNSTGFFSLVPP